MKEKLSSLINGTYVKDNPGLLEHPVCNVIIDFSRVSKVDSTALDKIKEVCVCRVRYFRGRVTNFDRSEERKRCSRF